MFTVEDRERVRERLIEAARADARIVAAAEVGSLTAGLGDRWSDLDLTFGVDTVESIAEVLADWTESLKHDFHAAHLFDLPLLSTIYRVFLLPGALQVDLSFTPARDFGPLGPKWSTLFGETVSRDPLPPPDAAGLLGRAVHGALRARVCIEREKPLAAEYWLSEARDYALSLASLHLGLPANYARGFDSLPPEATAGFEETLATSLDRAELERALRAVVALIEREAAAELTPQLRDELRMLASPD